MHPDLIDRAERPADDPDDTAAAGCVYAALMVGPLYLLLIVGLYALGWLLAGIRLP